jgi:hypothetical protein
MIEVELPDGRVVEVDTTDSNVAAQAAQKFLSTKAPETSMLADAGKSVASGLGRATIGAIGGLGDFRDLASQGMSALGNKLGVDLSPVKTAAAAASSVIPGLGLLRNAPTSQDVRSTITDPVVSPDYQPQSVLGSYLKTAAEFTPGMLSGGRSSLGANLLRNVAAPAIASETAGQVTQGTAAEPYARLLGALGGSAGVTKALNAAAEARAISKATPALENLKSTTGAGYDALTARNVATPMSGTNIPISMPGGPTTIQQGALDGLVNDIRDTLNKKGIRPSNADSIHKAIEEIRTPATAGVPDVADLVAARQSIKELLGKPDTNKTGAFITLGKLDQAIEAASPGTMTKIKELDKNWAAVKANEALDKRTAAAELRAAGENSGGNVGNKIRQQVTNYLLSNEARYLSPETKKELEKIVRGTASQNTVRFVANLLGGGGGLGMLAGATAGYQVGDVPGAIAGAAAGKALKFANNRSVVKQAERAAEGIRLRSPMGQQNPLTLPQGQSPLLAGLRAALLARPKLSDVIGE